ncbi:MAG: Flp pilus assembly complex ATPase component TadA [Phycisphaerales bacterium]|nr:Flp pilus assembly complex ATPase component TadA [Phycisphaerales bacterium]
MSLSSTTQQAARRHPLQKRQLGEMLVERELISEDQLQQALEEQRSRSKRKLLGELLVELNLVTEEQIIETVAVSYGVPYVKLNPRLADPRVTELLPKEFIEEHAVLPLFRVEGVLTIAVCELENLFLIEEVERLSGCKIQIVAAAESDIRSTSQSYLPDANVFVIDDIYEDVDDEDFSVVVEKQVTDLGDLELIAGQSPVVKLVNYIIYSAVQDRASDIHIEADDHRSRVRYRVDGGLFVKLTPPYQMHPAIVSRIKIMSKMDIAERRQPQDGDIHVRLDGRPIDLRVSTMPAKFGEKVVIRIIDNRNSIVPIEKIGFDEETLVKWREIISHANGVVIVSGPTGSGKSTTLYSVLSELSTDDLNVSTVENPVEANLPGINQFQTNTKAGFTFGAALRAMLRQDPDILMVGEIRDQETALIATQAALTGHLVFSTLHTNDAVSAVTRLINMGVEPFLVAAILRGVLAQRLVRKICPHCKESYEPEERTRAMLGLAEDESIELFRGAGCSRCRGTGFAGRLGIFELFIPDDEMCEAISRNAHMHELKEIAVRQGFYSLREDGLAKARAGLTTVEEVFCVTS